MAACFAAFIDAGFLRPGSVSKVDVVQNGVDTILTMWGFALWRRLSSAGHAVAELVKPPPPAPRSGRRGFRTERRRIGVGRRSLRPEGAAQGGQGVGERGRVLGGVPGVGGPGRLGAVAGAAPAGRARR